jgi:histone acetyltransferase (RNA polymerase elongator complex component)
MPRNLLQKSERDLALLHSEGLSLVYVGIESGNDLILRKVTKGALSSSIIEACQKASRSGFNLSCMVILGLGGTKYTSHHVSDTARILSRISPQYAAALSLSLEDDIYSEFMEKFGESFQPLDDIELIDELERLITEISPNSPIIFRANHASNIYSVGGLIPNDRERMLETIRSIRKRPNIWKPKYLRRF